MSLAGMRQRFVHKDKKQNGNMNHAENSRKTDTWIIKVHARNDKLSGTEISGKIKVLFRWKKDHPYVPVRIHRPESRNWKR